MLLRARVTLLTRSATLSSVANSPASACTAPFVTPGGQPLVAEPSGASASASSPRVPFARGDSITCSKPCCGGGSCGERRAWLTCGVVLSDWIETRPFSAERSYSRRATSSGCSGSERIRW